MTKKYTFTFTALFLFLWREMGATRSDPLKLDIAFVLDTSSHNSFTLLLKEEEIVKHTGSLATKNQLAIRMAVMQFKQEKLQNHWAARILFPFARITRQARTLKTRRASPPNRNHKANKYACGQLENAFSQRIPWTRINDWNHLFSFLLKFIAISKEELRPNVLRLIVIVTGGGWTMEDNLEAKLKLIGQHSVVLLLPTETANGLIYFPRIRLTETPKQYPGNDSSLLFAIKKQEIHADLVERILLAIRDVLRKNDATNLRRMLHSSEETAKREDSLNKIKVNTTRSSYNSFGVNDGSLSEAVIRHISAGSSQETSAQIGEKKPTAKEENLEDALMVTPRKKFTKKNRKTRFPRMKETEDMKNDTSSTPPILFFKVHEVNGNRDKVFVPEIEVISKEEYDMHNKSAYLKLIREASNEEIRGPYVLSDDTTDSVADGRRPLWPTLRINVLYFALLGSVLLIMVTSFLCRKKRKQMIRRYWAVRKSFGSNYVAPTTAKLPHSEKDRANEGDSSNSPQEITQGNKEEGTTSSGGSSVAETSMEWDGCLSSAPATSHQDAPSVKKKDNETHTSAAALNSSTMSAFDMLPEKPSFKSILWNFFCHSLVATSARKIEATESVVGYAGMSLRNYDGQRGEPAYVGNNA